MESPAVALLIFVTVVALAAVVLLRLRSYGGLGLGQRHQTGALLSVDLTTRELVVSIPRGQAQETRIFALEAGAPLTRDGAPAALEALQEGDLVEIVYSTQGHRALACGVRARAGAAAKGAPRLRS